MLLVGRVSSAKTLVFSLLLLLHPLSGKERSFAFEPTLVAGRRFAKREKEQGEEWKEERLHPHEPRFRRPTDRPRERERERERATSAVAVEKAFISVKIAM